MVAGSGLSNSPHQRLRPTMAEIALTPLILAGGKSTRMKSPKHLLTMPDGRPLYQHQCKVLAKACPESPVVYMSLAQDSKVDGLQRTNISCDDEQDKAPSASTDAPKVRIIHDLHPNETTESAGPAAGLLAAFSSNPHATWLVVPCDSPFLNTAVLERLRGEYEPPVTCFRNSEGFCEPLIGIWSPEALGRLAENAARGRAGPSAVVKGLGGKQITLPDALEGSLVDVNTKEEWDAALEVLNSSG